jgi:hypothetical protein
MLAGQVVEDWGKVSDRLCQTFGAQDCRVRSVPGRPHEIEAWFLTNDPLQEVVEPHQHEVPVRLDALPVGLHEDGEVYRLPLLGNHLLLSGEIGSGKRQNHLKVQALARFISDHADDPRETFLWERKSARFAACPFSAENRNHVLIR